MQQRESERARQRKKKTGRGGWRWKNGKIVLHTSTDVPFTQLTDIFFCLPINDEKKPLSNTRGPKASLDTHINMPVCQNSRREVWVAESSV